jgi:bifunctional UDP-N-acetylglucosamine pyrophosphorylase/glucosamine-1-phosphate N-acetyltransferase
MTKRKLAAVVLAAGRGTRMKSDIPKVLHPLAGRPMIHDVLDTVRRLGAERLVVVVGPAMAELTAAVTPVPTVLQAEPCGTADAVMAARDALDGFAGDVLVLFGDSPLIRAETVEAMVATRAAKPVPAIVVLGMRLVDPEGYGRLIIGADGALDAVVEHRDATPEQHTITLCNSGVMLIDGARLFDMLAEIGNDNAKGEYYCRIDCARRQCATAPP